MNEKEILGQLNKFQDVKPDDAWKKSNREILLSQISNSQSTNVEFSWAQTFRIHMQALTNMSQPAMAVVLIMLFIVSGGTLGLRASQGTKPGDSLYIAKIISEKAQLAMAFNDESKVKLGIAFAGNRADELTQVLASKDDQPMSVSDKQEVSSLVDSLKQQIINVKSQAEKIQPATSEVAVKPTEDDGGKIFAAGAGKMVNGLQVSEKVNIPAATKATGTPVVKEADTKTILEQAKEYLKQENYDAAISKLEEAGKVINIDGGGAAKSDGASTTDGVKN